LTTITKLYKSSNRKRTEKEIVVMKRMTDQKQVAMDLFELVQSLHDDRLRAAEKQRLYQQAALDAPPFRKRLLLRLGNLIVFAGALWARLKANSAVQA
jgi:hypothetical protein